jgi:1-acyl-sn-glycerol-3-phosphate acyltransferase
MSPSGPSTPDTLLPEGAWPWLHDFGRWLATWIFRFSLRIRAHHTERVPRTGPVVLVCNHSSLLDGPIVFGIVHRRSVFLIKQEMFSGVLKPILPRIGQIPVRRGMAERAPLLAAVRVLRAGGMIGVFPEGARGSGDVAEAQNGAAWLARSGGAVVLPVAVRGTRRPEGRRGFRRRVDVLVGEPIDPPADRGRAGLTAATEKLRGELATLVAELDRLRAGGTPEIGRTNSGER